MEASGNPTADDLDRQDARDAMQAEQRQRQADAQQKEVQREQEAQQKAAADLQKRQANTAKEAKYRTGGVETYTDAFGEIQPVVDPLTNKPKQRDLSGPVEWDATGKAYKMERPAGGQWEQKFVDAKADVGPNPADPNDRFIYKKNTQQPWEAIDPERGVFADDNAVRLASAGRLREQKESALNAERAKLKVELAKLGPSSRSQAFTAEEKAAQEARQKASVRLAEIDAEFVGVKSKSLDALAKEEQARLGPQKAAEARAATFERQKQNIGLLRKASEEEKARLDEEAARLDRLQIRGLRADQIGAHAAQQEALKVRQQAWEAKAGRIQELENRTNSAPAEEFAAAGKNEPYAPAKLGEMAAGVESQVQQFQAEAAAFNAENQRRAAEATTPAAQQAYQSWFAGESAKLDGRRAAISRGQMTVRQAHNDVLSREIDNFAGILEREAGKVGALRKSWSHIPDAEGQTAVRNEERRAAAGGEAAKEIRQADKDAGILSVAAALPTVEVALRLLGIDDVDGLQEIMHRTASLMRQGAVKKGAELVSDTVTNVGGESVSRADVAIDAVKDPALAEMLIRSAAIREKLDAASQQGNAKDTAFWSSVDRDMQAEMAGYFQGKAQDGRNLKLADEQVIPELAKLYQNEHPGPQNLFQRTADKDFPVLEGFGETYQSQLKAFDVKKKAVLAKLPKHLQEYAEFQAALQQPIGFWEGFGNFEAGTGMKDIADPLKIASPTTWERIPFMGDAVRKASLEKVADIAGKLEAGQELTKFEMDYIKSWAIYHQRKGAAWLDSKPSYSVFSAGNAGRIIGESLKFGTEMALTGGLSGLGRATAAKLAASGIAKWGTAAGVAKLTNLISGRMLQSGLAATTASKSIGLVAAGLTTTAMNPVAIANRVLDLRTAPVNVGLGEKGQLAAFIDPDWQRPSKSASVYQATATQAAENISELTGGAASQAMGKLFKAGGSALAEVLPDKLVSVLARAGAGARVVAQKTGAEGFVKALSQADGAVARAMKFHGVGGEMLEERVVEVMKIMLGMPQSEHGMIGNLAKGQLGEAIDQLLLEGVAFAGQGAALSLPAQALDKISQRRMAAQNLPGMEGLTASLMEAHSKLPDEQIMQDLAGLPALDAAVPKLAGVASKIAAAQESIAAAGKNKSKALAGHKALADALLERQGIVQELAALEPVQTRQRAIAEVQQYSPVNDEADAIAAVTPTEVIARSLGADHVSISQLQAADEVIANARQDLQAATTVEEQAAAHQAMAQAHQVRLMAIAELAGKMEASPEQIAAADQELAAAPDQASAGVVRAALKLHRSGVAAMDVADLAALGLERKGESLVPVKDAAAPDGLPRVTMEDGGAPVFTQTFLDRIGESFPAVAAVMPRLEMAQRALNAPPPAAKPVKEKAQVSAPASVAAPSAGERMWQATIDGQAEPVQISARDQAEAMSKAAQLGKGMVADVSEMETTAPEPKPVDAEENLASAMASASGAAAPTSAHRRQAKALIAAVNRWGKAFGGIEFRQDDGSDGLAFKSGKLVVNLESLGRNAWMRLGRWSDRAVMEEAIHAVAVYLESQGYFSAAELFDLLPDLTKEKVADAYRTVDQRDPDRSWLLGHEFIRMVVQGRITAGELTESRNPTLLATLKNALEAIADFFRDLAGQLRADGAAADVVKKVTDAVDLLETRVRALDAAPETKTPPGSGQTAGGVNVAAEASPGTPGTSSFAPGLSANVSETETNASGLVGAESVVTQNGKKVRVRFVVQEAAQARPSHDAAGNPTPGYNQALQPRDRSLPEYRRQAQNIARNLDFATAAFFPDTTTPATTPDLGAPVMTKAGDTIIGNGREIAIKLAYESGEPAAQRYRQELIDNAEKFGLDPAAVAQLQQPVLKREIIDELPVEELVRFSQESNAGVAMATNATEYAAQDAGRIDVALLSLLDPNYPLDSAKNAAFLSAYTQRVIRGDSKSNEANVTSSELLRRVRAGIFVAAYGLDKGGRQALDRLAGDADDGARKITAALLAVAPVVARARRDMTAGTLHQADIAPALTAAVQKISVALREAKKPAEAYATLVESEDMFDAEPLADAVLKFLVENRKSQSDIVEALSTYHEMLYQAGNPQEGDMFGDVGAPDALALWQRAIDPRAAAARAERHDEITRELRTQAERKAFAAFYVEPGPVMDSLRAFNRRVFEAGDYAPGRNSDQIFHFTAGFGIRDELVDAAVQALAGIGPIDVTMGKTALIANHLSVLLEGSDIERMRKVLAPFLEHPDRKITPHITIAIVKPGAGEKYVGDSSFVGQTIRFDSILFNRRTGRGNPVVAYLEPAADLADYVEKVDSAFYLDPESITNEPVFSFGDIRQHIDRIPVSADGSGPGGEMLVMIPHESIEHGLEQDVISRLESAGLKLERKWQGKPDAVSLADVYSSKGKLDKRFVPRIARHNGESMSVHVASGPSSVIQSIRRVSGPAFETADVSNLSAFLDPPKITTNHAESQVVHREIWGTLTKIADDVRAVGSGVSGIGISGIEDDLDYMMVVDDVDAAVAKLRESGIPFAEEKKKPFIDTKTGINYRKFEVAWDQDGYFDATPLSAKDRAAAAFGKSDIGIVQRESWARRMTTHAFIRYMPDEYKRQVIESKKAWLDKKAAIVAEHGGSVKSAKGDLRYAQWKKDYSNAKYAILQAADRWFGSAAYKDFSNKSVANILRHGVKIPAAQLIRLSKRMAAYHQWRMMQGMPVESEVVADNDPVVRMETADKSFVRLLPPVPGVQWEFRKIMLLGKMRPGELPRSEFRERLLNVLEKEVDKFVKGDGSRLAATATMANAIEKSDTARLAGDLMQFIPEFVYLNHLKDSRAEKTTRLESMILARELLARYTQSSTLQSNEQRTQITRREAQRSIRLRQNQEDDERGNGQQSGDPPSKGISGLREGGGSRFEEGDSLGERSLRTQGDLFEWAASLPAVVKQSKPAFAAAVKSELPRPVQPKTNQAFSDLFDFASNRTDNPPDEPVQIAKSPARKPAKNGGMGAGFDLFDWGASSTRDEAGSGGNSEMGGQPGGNAPPGDGTGDGIRGNRDNDGQGAGESTGGGTNDLPAESSGPTLDELRPRVARPAPGTPERNFSFAATDRLQPSGLKAKLKANLEALDLLRVLEAEDRLPTTEEKSVLARYSGWGALSQVFDEFSYEGQAEIERDIRTWKQLAARNPYDEVYAARVREYEEKLEKNNRWRETWGESYERIKAELSPEEWNAARDSTINAHYTSPPVISSMWAAVRRFGFRGGNVLEPAGGIGHFFGLMPEEFADRSRLYGVELDRLTARIFAKLYPEAKVQQRAYQKTEIPTGSIDLAISNVPFANLMISDEALPGAPPDFSLHNYFFAKALQHVRPGGIIAFITSAHTMDSSADQRKWLAERAEFVGAIRLPNTAFRGNASTDVVTDIIFLRKPDGSDVKMPRESWSKTAPVTLENGTVLQVNEYFARHPEMILGRLADDGSMYGGKDKKEMTVHPDETPLPDALALAVERLPENIMDQVESDALGEIASGRDIGLKPGQLYVEDDVLKRWGSLVPPPPGVIGFDFIRARDALNNLYALERNPKSTDVEIESARRKLNEEYDRFVKRHGIFHERKVAKQLAGDPDFFKLVGLEIPDKAKKLGKNEKQTYSKASVFTRRALSPVEPPGEISSVADGIVASLAWKGRVDPRWIAARMTRSIDDVVEELWTNDAVFNDPETGLFEPRDLYLSGNVRKKLATAKAAAGNDERLMRNVSELEKVQPAPIPFEGLYPRLGAGWVPPDIISRWLRDEYDSDIKVIHVLAKGEGSTDSWKVLERSVGARGALAGTSRMSLGKTLLNALNLTYPRFTDPDGSGGRVFDKTGTEAAKAAIEKLKESFEKWARGAQDSIKENLTKAYNDKHNGFVKRVYDGQHLTMPWVSKEFELYPSKKNVVWRAISDRRVLVAHGVGGGKAQPLDARILTPTGWKLMGEIKVGDEVIAGDGSATAVTGVFPQGEKDIFRVSMSDGASTETCGEHLWLTHTYYSRSKAQEAKRLGKQWECGKPEVRTLDEIRNTLHGRNVGGREAVNHSIPMVGAAQFALQPVPLSPYFVGVLIGDGSLTQGTPSFSKPDKEIADKVAAELPDGVSMRRVAAGGKCDQWTFTTPRGAPNPVTDALRALNLQGTHSHERFVPDCYKWNGPDVRLAVLQGLMDTDGWADKRGTSLHFSTSSRRLADDMAFLVQSLGGTASIRVKHPTFTHLGEKKQGRPAYSMTISLPEGTEAFRLARKASVVVPKTKYPPRRYITAVEPVGKKLAQCISVAHPSHLYVTDDFIVTHNTVIGTAIAMELRRFGLAKKPLILVHNATLEQFAAEIGRMAPQARILVARKEDLEGDSRREFYGRIASGDWDAVVMAHSTFDRIPDDPAAEEEALQELIDELVEAIKEGGGSKSKDPTVKEWVKMLEKLRAQIAKLKNRKNVDTVMTFQEMGIDALIVDEAHLYKKLPFMSKIKKVMGIDKGASKRGTALMTRARWIQKLNRGGNVFTMTGTPVTNTLGETWNAIRLIAPDILKDQSVSSFDSFVTTFAKIETRDELGAGNKYKRVTRLARFSNLPEWNATFGQIADIKLGGDMDVKNRPEIDGGGPQLIDIPITPGVSQFTAFIRQVSDLYDQSDPKVKKEFSHVPLTLYGAARAASIDLRLVDPSAPDEPGSKVNRMVEEVLKIANETKDYSGTQVIFSDSIRSVTTDALRAFAGGDFRVEVDEDEDADSEEDGEDDDESATGFNVYEEIRRKLIAGGMKPDEVALIAEAKNDKQREEIFNRVNEGSIRVIIGSTQKLGTGVNMQRLMKAAHQLDVPWTPAEIEQREGRVYRQGNIHGELKIPVRLIRYGMRETLDAALWQKQEDKARITKEALSGKLTAREIDDDAALLSAAETKAILTGPDGLKLFRLQQKLRELDSAEATWRHGKELAYVMHLTAQGEKNYSSSAQPLLQRLVNAIGPLGVGEIERTWQFNGKEISKADLVKTVNQKMEQSWKLFEDGQALASNLPTVGVVTVNGVPIDIGKPRVSRGTDNVVMLWPVSVLGMELPRTGASWMTETGKIGIFMADQAAAITSGDTLVGVVEKSLAKAMERLAEIEGRLAKVDQRIEAAKKMLDAPFEQAAEMEAVVRELNELMDKMSGREKVVVGRRTAAPSGAPREAPMEPRALSTQGFSHANRLRNARQIRDRILAVPENDRTLGQKNSLRVVEAAIRESERALGQWALPDDEEFSRNHAGTDVGQDLGRPMLFTQSISEIRNKFVQWENAALRERSIASARLERERQRVLDEPPLTSYEPAVTWLLDALIHGRNVLLSGGNAFTSPPIYREGYDSHRRDYDRAAARLLQAMRVAMNGLNNQMFAVSDLDQRALFTQGARDEMAEIERRTKADGTWLLAPNGKPTNLTARQWVQVRTKRFKDWFGDWEAMEKRNALDSMPAIAVDSSPLGNAADVGFQNNARSIYRTLGQAVNRGRTIQFVMSGFRKLRSHSADSRTLRIIPGLKTLMERAILIRTESDDRKNADVLAWHFYAARAVLDGEAVYVKLVVREERGGRSVLDFFDDSTVTTEKAIQTPAFNAGPDSLSKDKLRQWWQSVNPTGISKVVDENGEPMVVYHGTARVSVFDVATRQVWLTDDPLVAEHYAGYNEKTIMPLFARITAPLEAHGAEDIIDVLESQGLDSDAISDSLGADTRFSWAWIQEGGKKVTQAIEEAGHDGVMAYDDWLTVDEDSPLLEAKGEGIYEHQSWVVFHPTQIKSATENSGEYGPDEPSILRTQASETPQSLLAELESPLDASQKEALGRAMLGESGKPGMFRYKDSNSTDLAQVLRDFGLPTAEIEVIPNYYNNHLHQKTGSIEISLPGVKGKVMLLDTDRKDVRINSYYTGNLEPFQASAIYQAAYTWMLNNGKRSVPDYKYTDDGIFRRVSQMISSALRHKTVRHLHPHRQVRLGFVGGEGEADPRLAFTIGELAYNEAKMTLQRLVNSGINPYGRKVPGTHGAGDAIESEMAVAPSDEQETTKAQRMHVRIGKATADRASWVALWLRTHREFQRRGHLGDVGNVPEQRPDYPALPPRSLYTQPDTFEELLKKSGVDLAALDAITDEAGGEKSPWRTVGRPDLAFGAGIDTPADPVILGMDAYRQATATPQTFEDWDRQARAIVETDYDGAMRHVVNYAMDLGGVQLDAVWTRVAQILVERESRLPLTPDRQRKLQAIVWAYREAGTTQARGFAARRDPFKTPSERHREFLVKSILTPPAAIRKKMEEAATTQEKQAILEADRTGRLAKIEAAFSRMGITLDDIFNGDTEVNLKKSIFVQRSVAHLSLAQKRAVELLQGAEKSFKEIAKVTGLTVDQVQTIKADVVARIRADLMRRVQLAREANRSLSTQGEEMIDVDFAALANLSPAELEAELEKLTRRMGFFPDAQQGKRKTVRRPKQRIFVPPPVSAVESPDRPMGRPTAGYQQPLFPPRQTPDRPMGPPTAGRQPGLFPPAEPSPDRPMGRPTRGGQQLLWSELPARDVSVLRGADMGNPEDAVGLSRTAAAAVSSGMDALQEFWINNILSGPTTQTVNIIGNTASGVWEFTVQRGMDALLNLVFRNEDAATFGEMKYIARALTPGAARAARLMAKTWRSETDWFMSDVMDKQMNLFETGPQGEGHKPAIKGAKGRVIRVPGRALMAMDAFFKGQLGTMEAAAQAYRIAKKEGLNGEPLQLRINELVNTPGSQAWQLAVQKARELTFQEDLPQLVKDFQRLRNSSRILQFIFPFIRTPYNIFRTGIRKSPVGALNLAWHLGKHGLAKMGADGITTAAPPQMIRWLAEQTLAWIAMAMFYGAMEGDDDDDKKWLLITGSPPKESGQRALQERSLGGSYVLKIGPLRVNYGRIEPLATILGTTTDMIRTGKGGGDSGKRAATVIDSIRAQTLNKTFLDGLANLVDAVERPGKWDSKMKDFLLKAIVPNIIRQPLRNIDETPREYASSDWWYPAFPVPAGSAPKVDPATGEDKTKGGNAASRILFPPVPPVAPISDLDKTLRKYNRENPEKAWGPEAPDDVLTYTPKQGDTPAVRIKLNKNAFHALQVRSATLAKEAMEGMDMPATEAGINRIRRIFEDAREKARQDLRKRAPELLGEVIK